MKAAHLAGELGLSARSLAKAIVEDFEGQGIDIAGMETVRVWLGG